MFNEHYFKSRNLNDKKRVKSFRNEKNFVMPYLTSGNLLDIGCSTGEMLEIFNWDGQMYGMEISSEAKQIAKGKGILFDRDIFNTKDFFDVIIFRGTIQHIDTPFLYLKQSYKSLKKGGKIVFLATPNANSIYFKLWGTLPFLDLPSTNYFIPHDNWFIQAMENIGFILVDKKYPYINSPYSNLLLDHLKFLLKLFGVNTKFAFWGNSMDLIFKKT